MRPMPFLAGIALAGLCAAAANAQAPLNPLPPQSPSVFRPPPTPTVGFYGRSYYAPGFSSVPSQPNYNSVSFYGRSYRPSGFSPVPANFPPVVMMYGTEYRLPGAPPQTLVQFLATTTGQPPTLAVPQGFSVAVPEGFTVNNDLGSYSTLSYFAPGSFVPSNFGY
jgi:hypothetical protein